MLPLTQPTAGWLLVLASLGVFAQGFVLRWLVRRRRGNESVRRMLIRLRTTPLARLLYGPAPDGVDAPGDEEIDEVTLLSMVAVAAITFVAGMALIVADSFGVEFRLFKAP